MRNLRKPAFFFGLAGVVIFFIGLTLHERESANQALAQGSNSSLVMYAGLVMGAIFWIWSVVEVATSTSAELKYYQKMFWLILVVSVPFFGGLLFHFLHQRPGKIVT